MAKKPTIITKKRKGVEISVDAETKKILSEPSLLGDRRLDVGTRSTVDVNFGKNKNPILSNFSESPFKFKGRRFKTAEGAYQAFKSGKYVAGFEELSGPQAKSLGRNVQVDKKKSESIMREVLTEKYNQVPKFRKALRQTSGEITHSVGDKFWAEKFPEILTSLRDIKYTNTTYESLDPDIKDDIVQSYKKNIEQYQFQYDSRTKPPTDTPAGAFSYAKKSKPPQKYTGFVGGTSSFGGTTPYRYKYTGMLAPDVQATDYLRNLIKETGKRKTINIAGHTLPSEVVRKIADTDLVTATWSMSGSKKNKFNVHSQEAKQFLFAHAGVPDSMAEEFQDYTTTRHIDIPEDQRYGSDGGQYVQKSIDSRRVTKRKPDLIGRTQTPPSVVPQDEVIPVSQARTKGGTYGGLDLPDKDLPKVTILTEISKELHDVVGTTPEDVPEGFVDNAGFVDEEELKHSGFQIRDAEKPEAGALVVQEPVLSTSPQAKRAKELGNLIVEQQRDMRSDRTTTLTDTQLVPEFSGGKKSELVREGTIATIDELDRSPLADAQRSARVTEQDLNIQIAKKGSDDFKKLQLNIRDAKKQVPKEPNLAVSWDIENPVTLQQARDVARKTTETILTGSNIDRGKPHNVLDVSLVNEGPSEPLGPTIPQQESYEISQSLNKPKQKVQSRERSWKSRLVQSRGAKVLTALATIPGLDFLLTPVDVAQAHDTVIKPRQEKYGGSGLASGRDRDYGKVMQAGKRKVTPLTEFKNWKEWDAVKGFSAWAKNRSQTARSLRR